MASLTLKELARQAGVHPSTISRVLNGDESVRFSAETRARILELVQETGYRPHRVARSLKRRETGVVAAIIPDITNPIFASIFRGFEDATSADDYAAILCSTDDRAGRLDRSLRLLDERLVDGVVLATALRSDADVQRLLARGESFVLVNRSVDGLTDRCVVADDRHGAELAVEHLLALGHRRIGHVGGLDRVMTGYRRRLGYRAALARAGIPYDEALVVESDYTREGGYEATLELFRRGAAPTALLAVTDMVALGAYAALAEMGLKVPEDVAVIGFNDIPLASHTSPPLTTVRVPLYDMGFAAGKLLIGLLGGQSAPQQVFPVELIVRGSTAPVQNGQDVTSH